ncbi:hypothetical protein ACJX0J_042239, partial [Zea mays]
MDANVWGHTKNYFKQSSNFFLFNFLIFYFFCNHWLKLVIYGDTSMIFTFLNFVGHFCNIFLICAALSFHIFSHEIYPIVDKIANQLPGTLIKLEEGSFGSLPFSGVIDAAYDGLFIGSQIWKTWAPPKCRFFLWLVAHKKCWTTDRLE